MESGGTCRYGSVVGVDALLRADTRTSMSATSAVDAVLGACDECEQQPARVECDDCGLVYCAPCDAHRHRKGKLLFHQRQDLPTASDNVRTNDAPSPLMQTQPQQQHESPAALGALAWSVEQVSAWLLAHDLDVFRTDVSLYNVDGAFLLSSRMDELLETHSSASRGLKRKLQREIQKLRSDGHVDTTAAATGSSSVSKPLDEPLHTSQQASAARRWGANLRVNVNTSPAATATTAIIAAEQPPSFSPVTALRSRLVHGQGGETKGRINRRRSAFGAPSSVLLSPRGLEPAAAKSVQRVSTSTSTTITPGEPQRSKSVLFAPTQLRIDVADKALLVAPSERLTQSPKAQAQQLETRPSGGRTDLRSMRQALGGLDLDMLQVKNEERSVAASFDFSAEGRLQTHGFEINTQGIATAPFPHAHAASHRAPTSTGTREWLVLLHELGHGAGGKVFQALYVPTFKLLAVKVIRVFDQKKRHQMVRELKSLYVNFVAIDDVASRAACDELVVFYDAYTNPEIGSVSIVLEFMDCGSLEDRMQSGRMMSERELATIALCGLKGLAFLHEHHQLHRDIKLSNMLLNSQGQVKISDFGISRDLESTLAKATTFTGTLLYMAPERISGGTYSYPSDIWSFGLAIMALAIGQLPVPTKEGYWGVVHAVQEQPSPRLADYGTHFSPALCDFIDQCLQKNPMMRPPAAQLLEHAFIRDTYSPTAAATAVKPPDDPITHAKTLQELDHMATQVLAWCQSHADTLLSPTGRNATLFDHRSNRMRVEALAQQLRVPIATVAAKFAFLDDFCA